MLISYIDRVIQGIRSYCDASNLALDDNAAGVTLVHVPVATATNNQNVARAYKVLPAAYYCSHGPPCGFGK